MKKLPIIYRNEIYKKIRYFDCIEIDLEGYLGGGYCTTVPISDLKYREENKTQARVEVKEHTESGYTIFYIWDDYGHMRKTHIPSYMYKEIIYAIESAKKYKLLK